MAAALRVTHRDLVLATSFGDAHVALDRPTGARFLLVMTHGAGGGVDTADLIAVRDVAVGLGGAVGRVLQPFRVAGRKAPGASGPQDAAWIEIVTQLRKKVRGVPLIQGGRSNGARVACRTAPDLSPVGVIALAFPLHPPGRPENSRVDELRAARVPVLVVNGSRDPFGVPNARDATHVEVIEGEAHSFRTKIPLVAAAVEPWIRRWIGEA